MNRVCVTYLLALSLAAFGAACGGNSKTPSLDDSKPVLQSYAASLYQAYSDAVNDEMMFSTVLETFLTAPSDANLTAARTAWLASRAHYMLTESGRFYGGPIDGADDAGNPEAEINSWPLDEGYVDYTTNAMGVVDDTMGIVNNPSTLPTITVAGIDTLNAQGGDDNISDGYHAIEFLLWGQALQLVGPGQRPYTDYVTGGPRPNVDRRTAYIRAATAGVIQHLTAVRDAWAVGATYRTQFEGGEVGGQNSLALILTGLGRFSKGELGGDRMAVPYGSKSRRDQHDCFSSDTLTDYTRDAQGVQQMYLGTYGANGAEDADSFAPGISTLVAKADPTTDAMLKAQIATSITDMMAIPPPFESAIAGADNDPGRTAVNATINSVRSQGDLFVTAASSLGLMIVVPDSND